VLFPFEHAYRGITMKDIIFLAVMICWGTFFGHAFFADIGVSASRNWLGWIGYGAGSAAVFFTAYIIPPVLPYKKSPPSSSRQSSEQGIWAPFILFSVWNFAFGYTEVFLLPPDWAKVFPLLNICGLYFVWRFWPDRKTEDKAEDIAPETGADSEK
jgi:hypothetical protein